MRSTVNALAFQALQPDAPWTCIKPHLPTLAEAGRHRSLCDVLCPGMQQLLEVHLSTSTPPSSASRSSAGGSQAALGSTPMALMTKSAACARPLLSSTVTRVS